MSGKNTQLKVIVRCLYRVINDTKDKLIFPNKVALDFFKASSSAKVLKYKKLSGCIKIKWTNLPGKCWLYFLIFRSSFKKKTTHLTSLTYFLETFFEIHILQPNGQKVEEMSCTAVMTGGFFEPGMKGWQTNELAFLFPE